MSFRTDSRAEHEHPIPRHVRFYAASDRGRFNIPPHGPEEKELSADLAHQANTWLFGVTAKQDFNNCKVPEVVQMLKEHLDHRPMEGSDPTLRTTKQLNKCTRVQGVVSHIAGTETAVSSSSGTGTADAGILERSFRTVQNRVERLPEPAAASTPVVCQPSRELFMRGRSEAEVLRCLTCIVLPSIMATSPRLHYEERRVRASYSL